jgi:acyl CoA:acetate/3-ketoacid CoA transferase beta subunit
MKTMNAKPDTAQAAGLSEAQRAQIDQMVVTMARLVQDGDLLAEGIGTFLPNAAYMLAKHLHAPHSVSLCPNGNTLMLGTRILTLGRDEFDTVLRAMTWLDYQQINLIYMPSILLGSRQRWTEFMRPAQMDPSGATNNVCIGPYSQPRVRLPGSAGIPDASTAARSFYYYVPRHSSQVFVPTLDFLSGAGHAADGEGGPAEITVITNLCVLRSGPGGRLRVARLHPGVMLETVRDQTGFELDQEPELRLTEPPSERERQLLDTEIDPDGLRFLEVLAAPARRVRLRELCALEGTA